MLYSPKNYKSVESLASAFVIEAHSDTTINGVAIFGYLNGTPVAETTIEEDGVIYAVACPVSLANAII